MHKLLLLTVLSIGTFLPSKLFADIYFYTDNDGHTWLTNTLQLSYKAIDYKSSSKTNIQTNSNIHCTPDSSKLFQQRRARIDPIINIYSQRYGVSSTLVKAIVSVESCYDSNAVSSVGAMGLMQLMPGTAKELGVTDSFDINQNLHAGIKYFGKLNNKFKFNTHYALAAYNAGPTTVVKYGGIPPFSETESYVVKVIHKYKELMKNIRLN